MGETRNSYAKTDEDATFMRMKEDHMRNRQLKPGYNVRIAVNNEYIIGIEAFSDRADARTLKPFLRRLERFHQTRYEEVVADAGYESLDNHLHLESTGQTCCRHIFHILLCHNLFFHKKGRAAMSMICSLLGRQVK